MASASAALPNRERAVSSFIYFQDSESGLVETSRLGALYRVLRCAQPFAIDWERMHGQRDFAHADSDGAGFITMEDFLFILKVMAENDAATPQTILDTIEKTTSCVSSEDLERIAHLHCGDDESETATPATAKPSNAAPEYPLPPVESDAYTVRVDAADRGRSAAAAAAAFRSFGLVIVRNLLPAEVVERAYTEATGSLEKLLAAIDERGAEFGVGTKGGFAEVVLRCVDDYSVLLVLSHTHAPSSPLRYSSSSSSFLLLDLCVCVHAGRPSGTK